MFKVTKSGDWRRLGRYMRDFEDISAEEKDTLMRELAVWTLGRLVSHIEKQDLPWRPLKEAYMWRKASDGQEMDVYKATGEFRNKLAVRSTREGYQVGAFPQDTHRPSGLKMNVLAQILEYGSPDRGIPARPLLRPTMAELREKIRSLKGRYAKNLKRRYKEA